MQDAALEQPQIYLITPPELELAAFPDALSSALDAVEVACVRLALSSHDEDYIARVADRLREVCHARDIALVIERHVQLVERLGLDGVHLTDSTRSVVKTRKELGEEAIVGAFCGGSRHDGMTAAEMGVDYVAFGPTQASALGDGSFAEADLFDWWSKVIEVPVVAEGNLDVTQVNALAPVVDFFGIGAEIWTQDPATALRDLTAPLR